MAVKRKNGGKAPDARQELLDCASLLLEVSALAPIKVVRDLLRAVDEVNVPSLADLDWKALYAKRDRRGRTSAGRERRMGAVCR
jgi:hypothetical protein